MSNFPESIDVYVDKTGSDYVASSDPNVAYAGIETIQGLMGALGKPQSWSTTLMVLLRQYRSGMNLALSGGNLSVTSGEAVLENTNATKWVFRKNSTEVTLAVANLDVGTLVATVYYVYATGATAATTTPIMYSTDANIPSGIGTSPYQTLGWFKNEANGSLAVTYFGSIGGGGGAGGNVAISTLIGTAVVTATAWSDVTGLADISFVSTGKPVEIIASVGGHTNQAQYGFNAAVVIDGAVETDSERGFSATLTNGTADGSCTPMTLKTLAAGFHTIKVQIQLPLGYPLTVSFAKITAKEV